MHNFMKPVLLSLAALIVAAAPANAALVTSLPGATSIPLSATNIFTAGPVSVAPGITWSSTYDYSVIGFTDDYSLSSNGRWNGEPAFYGLNREIGTMTWAFDAAVSGAGGFVNYVPFAGAATMRVLDSGLNVLESYVLDISTDIDSRNAGEFWAIDRVGNDISYFQLQNAYFVLRDFVVHGDPAGAAAAIPEPMTLSLLGAGLAGIAMTRRRKQRA